MDDLSPQQVIALQFECIARALGEALLEGDLLEARFRTAEITVFAHELELTTVSDAASKMTAMLHPPCGAPGVGVGVAFAALHAAIEALHPPDETD